MPWRPKKLPHHPQTVCITLLSLYCSREVYFIISVNLCLKLKFCVRGESRTRSNYFGIKGEGGGYWIVLKITMPLVLCSLGWALPYKPKGHRFDSWSGHVPGLQVWSWVGGHMKGNQSMFLSHQCFSSFFPSPFLSC